MKTANNIKTVQQLQTIDFEQLALIHCAVRSSVAQLHAIKDSLGLHDQALLRDLSVLNDDVAMAVEIYKF